MIHDRRNTNERSLVAKTNFQGQHYFALASSNPDPEYVNFHAELLLHPATITRSCMPLQAQKSKRKKYAVTTCQVGSKCKTFLQDNY